MDRTSGIFVLIDGGAPGVQLGASDAHQTASRVQPERMGIIFNCPMNHIAGQTVLAGQHRHTTVFQAAEPALGCGPECTVLIESQLVDMALAQPVGGCVGCENVAVTPIGNATQKEPNPNTALQWIGGQNTCIVFMSQSGPGNLLNLTASTQLKETGLRVVDPKIPSFVLNYGKHSSAAGNAAYRIKAVVLQ